MSAGHDDLSTGAEGVPAAIALCVAAALAFALRAEPALVMGYLSDLGARLIDNVFCLAIIALAIAGLVYAALQAVGLQADDDDCRGARVSGMRSFLTGRPTRPAAPFLARIVAQGAPLERMADVADLWDGVTARRLALVQYLVWALPLLGFIGTVVGVSGSIGGLSDMIGAEGGGRTDALGEVLVSLRFAFDTTFAGLVGSLPLMAAIMMLRARAERVRRQLIERAMGLGEPA